MDMIKILLKSFIKLTINKVKRIYKILILSSSIIIFLSACKKEVNKSYSFFVAGHSYGKPGTTDLGIYKTFKNKFPYINSVPYMKFGVLTGDIVQSPSEAGWDSVDADIKRLGLDVSFAVGNHDMRNRELYEERYGITYYDMIINDDLFIILEPNIDEWNISGEQLEFFKTSVKANYKKVDNIFVLFHQLLWKEDVRFKNVKVNSLEGKADTINFWTEIEPVLHKTNKPVYMIAGDIGAARWSGDYMYYSYDNIKLIASGMGEGIGDNFLIINIDEFKNVDIDILALQGNINSLGHIEDYVLP